MDTEVLSVVAAVFVLAGFVKGVVGLGLPTVAIGLLTLVLLPAEAASILILPSVVSNLWQLLDGARLLPIARRLAPMLIATALATIAASGIIAGGNAALASAGLGVALLVYGVLGLLRFRMEVPARSEAWAGPIAGGITGIVTGATGVFTVPSVPYLSGLGFEPDDMVQALGLYFFVCTVALGFGLWLNGAYSLDAAWPSVWATLAALLGMWIGARVRRRIDPQTFRRWLFIALCILGMQLLVQNLF